MNSPKEYISTIKKVYDEYKQLYPFYFSVSINNTLSFRKFMENNKSFICNVLENDLSIEDSSTVFDEITLGKENTVFDKNAFQNLKMLFGICFVSAVIKLFNKQKKFISTDNKVLTKDNIKAFLESSKERNDWENYNKWYRGQSNYSWDLIPSFYRNFKKQSLIRINLSELFNTYCSFGLIDKASKTIGFECINYNFLSFMQHAVSFSPLLDFSSNPYVAVAMALSDTNNFREHYDNDSALFEVSVNPDKVVKVVEDIDKFIDKFNVYYYPTFPFMKTVCIKGDTYIIDTFDALIKSLIPQYVFIDVPTNDRMRFQSGKFVLFHDCLTIDGRVYAELAEDVRFEKYKLLKELKERKPGEKSFLDEMTSEKPEYSMTNMMNPYEWFGK